MPRLSLILLTLAILTTAADSSPACKSKAQARETWPKSYIAYRRIKGRRCWFAPTQGEAPSTASAAVPAAVSTSITTTWIVLPSTWDKSIWYPAGWQQELPPGHMVYSTFEGDPPDIWP